VATLVQGPIVMDDGPSFMDEILQNPEGMTARAFNNPPILGAEGTRAWRAAEIPAANGHASAASIGTIYGGVANGDGILTPEGIERAREQQVYGKDAVLPMVTRIANGFMLAPDEEPCGPNRQAFNHAGAGGSLGFCDPDNGIGLGYTMNLMHMGAWLVDPRARALVDAVYEGL
jgi:CubicO group peptidase (beta-lactamase class C family)